MGVLTTRETVDAILVATKDVVEGVRVPDGCTAADWGEAVTSVVWDGGIRLLGIPNEEVDAAPPFLTVLRVFIVSIP